MIKVMIYEPNKSAGTLTETDGSLASLQAIVGGWIEQVTIPDRPELALICNEEGQLLNLPKNRWGFVGTVLVARLSSDRSELVSLTESDLDWLRSLPILLPS